jgi:hypothetical protein
MQLRQNTNTGYWTDTEDPNLHLSGVHDVLVCRNFCAIHNKTSNHPLKDVPLEFCNIRGILTRTCDHGRTHPDYDAAIYYYSVNLSNETVHICDGCCGIS